MRLLAEMSVRQLRFLLAVLRDPIHGLQWRVSLRPVVYNICREIEIGRSAERVRLHVRHAVSKVTVFKRPSRAARLDANSCSY